MTMTRRLLIAWIVVAVTPAAFASSNVCVTARVDAPFWLPDGILRPAGMLTLCGTGTLSPVADLHVISVDRRPVGMFISRKSKAEAIDARSPEIVFERDTAGTLDLIGYTLPQRGRSIAYRLRGPERAHDTGAATVAVTLLAR